VSSRQVENPFAGQGSVLLDIGGDVGALVVTMPAGMVGVEVEIRPVGAAVQAAGHGHSHEDHDHAGDHHDHHDPAGGHHPHVAVVPRPVKDGVVPSLVFPELVEGRYELYVKETDDVELTVAITGGAVTSTEWPG
jgi:hypothetical protein